MLPKSSLTSFRVTFRMAGLSSVGRCLLAVSRRPLAHVYRVLALGKSSTIRISSSRSCKLSAVIIVSTI